MARTTLTGYTLNVSGGNFKGFHQNPDGSVTIKFEHFDDTKPIIKETKSPTFVRIPVSTLSSDDDFLCYTPCSEAEMKFKETIETLLARGKAKNFYIPFNANEIPLGNMPSHYLHYGDASCNAWINSCKAHGWELITVSKYRLLLAWMLKYLIENLDWDKSKAYKAFCNNSEILDEIDWEKVFGFKSFLTTGQRYLLPDDPEKTGCYQAYGGCNGRDWNYPLATIHYDSRRDCSKENAPYLIYGFVCKSE